MYMSVQVPTSMVEKHFLALGLVFTIGSVHLHLKYQVRRFEFSYF